MLYRSTNNQSPLVDFEQATIMGLAPDKGLYFPEKIPTLPSAFIRNIKSSSREDICFAVIKPFTGSSLPDETLYQIVSETVNFPIPLVKVEEDIYALELFHGPTMAFKDVGARFMSRCLGYFNRNNQNKLTVLVATSGDTGGAVASGFHNVEGIDVVILYPKGKVSKFQELQLTTFGGNVSALAVEGTFDQCQSMVKQAFADQELRHQKELTSANSINIARWLPQQFYYFFACQQWEFDQPPVFCVPSGNYGNICAGMMAFRTGLPVSHFVAACNANQAVKLYLDSGTYQSQQTVPTISNAMDVGDPSNFIRILELFEKEYSQVKKNLSAFTFSDAETSAILKSVYERTGYLMDTHGAVGYLGLQKYLSENTGVKGIFLETAHPLKFSNVVEPIIGATIPISPEAELLFSRDQLMETIPATYPALKDFLLAS